MCGKPDLRRGRMVRYVLNSNIVAIGTMGLTLLLAAPAAYGLARLPMRGKSTLLLINLERADVPGDHAGDAAVRHLQQARPDR